MGFELRIAVMRDPLEGRSGTEPASGKATTIVLNGALDVAASHEVLRVMGDEFEAGAQSIIVDLENVEANDKASMTALTDGLMSARANGRHVQLKVRSAELHSTMAALPDARDWLLADTEACTDGARLAIHLDGPSQHA